MPYTFVEIVNADGVFDSFFGGGPAINDAGIVTWQAVLDSGALGIYKGNPLSPIATTGSEFSSLGFSSINDRGQVAFYAEKGAQSGIYLSSRNSSALNRIAYEGQVLNDVRRPEQFTSFSFDPAINNKGQVAFIAGLTGNNSGVFIGNAKGKLERIVDTVGKFNKLEFADLIGTPFEGDVAPSMNDKGDIVFWGLLDKKLAVGAAEYDRINPAFQSGNVRGIYLKSHDSGIKTVVDNQSKKYLSFSGAPDINEDGDVAYIFRGEDLNNLPIENAAPYRGINLFENGKTTTVVDNNDHKGKDGYDEVDKFFRFGFVDINDNDTMAFSALFDPLGAEDAPVLGIFTAHKSDHGKLEIDKVIAVGDTVQTGTGSKLVDNLIFFNNEGLNNHGQLAFSLSFSDGTQGVYRADLLHNSLNSL
jgi:hypothetical protein